MAFELNDIDLAKSLDLLDGCETFPWSTLEDDLRLDDMLNFDVDFLSLPPVSFTESVAAVPVLPEALTPMIPLEMYSKLTPSPTSSGSWHPTSSSNFSSGSPSDVTATAVSTKKDPRIGKRKPEPRLDAITDVQERRKQRRLAKNRATAAVSRERKRTQMVTMEFQIQQLEADNAALASALTAREAQLTAARRRLAAAGISL